MKHYEQTDHLGNCARPYASPKRRIRDSHPVRHETGAVFFHTDKRLAVANAQVVVLSYRAEVVTITDYYPFGMALAERTYMSGEGYRYGFNGQETETETEITGTASHTSAEFWMYDSRLGRRWEVDPFVVVSISGYSCYYNSPIKLLDRRGASSGDHVQCKGSINPTFKLSRNLANCLGFSNFSSSLFQYRI